MATQRWNDEMLDRLADQFQQRMERMDQQMSLLLEGQRMLVEYYQQEHESRVESDRIFKRFMERTDRSLESHDRLLESHQQRMDSLSDAVNDIRNAVDEIRRYIRFSRENGSRN